MAGLLPISLNMDVNYDSYYFYFSSKVMLIWLVCLCIGEAEPRALGIILFKTGPLSTVMLLTNNFSGPTLKLFFVLATAERTSFKTGTALF